MSDLTYSPAAPRTVWVFAIDLPKEQIAAFNTETYSEDGDLTGWPLMEALGVAHLDHDGLEVIDLKEIEDYGFAAYLSEANGMDRAQVAPMADKLDAMSGPVLLVFSSAFDGRQVTMNPNSPLRHIGTFSEPLPDSNLTRLEAESAKGIAGAPDAPIEPSEPNNRGSIWVFAAFFTFGALLLAIMIWSVLT